MWLCGCFSWPAHVPRTCKHGICPPNALPQHWLAPQPGGSSRVGTGSLLSRQDTRASSLPAPGPAPRTPGSCLTWIISQTQRFFYRQRQLLNPKAWCNICLMKLLNKKWKLASHAGFYRTKKYLYETSICKPWTWLTGCTETKGFTDPSRHTKRCIVVKCCPPVSVSQWNMIQIMKWRLQLSSFSTLKKFNLIRNPLEILTASGHFLLSCLTGSSYTLHYLPSMLSKTVVCLTKATSPRFSATHLYVLNNNI